MPSRTAVYGVGAATGIVVGLVIAHQLGALPGRAQLGRLFGAGAPAPAAPTHIVLPEPDLGPASPREPAAAVDELGAVVSVSPVVPA